MSVWGVRTLHHPPDFVKTASSTDGLRSSWVPVDCPSLLRYLPPAPVSSSIQCSSPSVPVQQLPQHGSQTLFQSGNHCGCYLPLRPGIGSGAGRRGERREEETPERRGPMRRWQGSATMDHSLRVSTPVLPSPRHQAEPGLLTLTTLQCTPPSIKPVLSRA